MKNDRWPYALLINDIHADKNNLQEFETNMEEALGICKARGIQELVIGGDLWQSRSAQSLSVLMSVRNTILKFIDAGIEVVIAEGNHCKVDQESNWGYSHIFANYPMVTVINDFMVEDIDNGVTLGVIGYFPENGSFIDKLNELKAQEDVSNMILYIHEGINGALKQNNEKELAPDIFKDFKLVLVGHYHDRCKIGKNIEYIGASRQHNYGEDEMKGYTILYSDGSTEFVQNQANVRFTTITVNPDTLANSKSSIEQAVKEGKRVKVKIECYTDEAPAIDKQALLDMGVSKVEIKSETITVEVAAQAISAKYDKAEIKSEYASFCKQKEIDDVDTGLHYLDKIS